MKGVLGGYKWSVMLNIIRNLFSLSNTNCLGLDGGFFLVLLRGGDFWGFFIPL